MRSGKQLTGSCVAEPKYKIGQLVYFHPKREAQWQIDVARGPYQVLRRLPPTENGNFQYEIRSTLEEHDRVARESDMSPVIS